MLLDDHAIADIIRLGQRIYDERLKPILEPTHIGKFITINVLTGDYEMDEEDVAASDRAAERFGDAPTFTARVGYRTAHRLGSGSLRSRIS